MDFISFPQFLWQVFNFLLFYVVVARYVVPPVQKMIAKRQQEIAEGLEFAQKAKAELAESDAERKKIIDEARKEGAGIVEEAKKRSDILIAEAVEKAREEGQKELEHARARAQEEMAKRRAEQDKEVVELAMSVVEKSLRESLGTTHDLVKKEIHTIKNVKEYVQ